MDTNRAEIKFQLYEGREKQSLLEKYLNGGSALNHRQDLINPYTGESIESKLLGAMRDHNPIKRDSEARTVVFESEENFGSHDDITNLGELVKRKHQGRSIITENHE